jgi:uncharacterized membrane protein
MLLGNLELFGVMNTIVVAVGLLIILSGLVLAVRSRSRDETEIEIGKFSGPIWLLLIVLGISTTIAGLSVL